MQRSAVSKKDPWNPCVIVFCFMFLGVISIQKDLATLYYLCVKLPSALFFFCLFFENWRLNNTTTNQNKFSLLKKKQSKTKMLETFAPN